MIFFLGMAVTGQATHIHANQIPHFPNSTFLNSKIVKWDSTDKDKFYEDLMPMVKNKVICHLSKRCRLFDWLVQIMDIGCRREPSALSKLREGCIRKSMVQCIQDYGTRLVRYTRHYFGTAARSLRNAAFGTEYTDQAHRVPGQPASWRNISNSLCHCPHLMRRSWGKGLSALPVKIRIRLNDVYK